MWVWMWCMSAYWILGTWPSVKNSSAFDVHTYTLSILCTAKISRGSIFFFFFFLVIKWEHLKCAYTHKILLCKHFNTWESVGPSTLPEGGYSSILKGGNLSTGVCHTKWAHCCMVKRTRLQVNNRHRSPLHFILHAVHKTSSTSCWS